MIVNVVKNTKLWTSKRFVKVTERKTMPDWADFLEEISKEYPQAEKPEIIQPNGNAL
ncbi:MAG: hypothetical protein FWD66_03500 [Paludibacter sp.]|nr:hypothetical protein [Paludibacter sp.]